MTVYLFEAFGKLIDVEADGFDPTDERKNALVKANKWLWSLDEFKADTMGCWFPKTRVNEFSWVPGNFFD